MERGGDGGGVYSHDSHSRSGAGTAGPGARPEEFPSGLLTGRGGPPGALLDHVIPVQGKLIEKLPSFDCADTIKVGIKTSEAYSQRPPQAGVPEAPDDGGEPSSVKSLPDHRRLYLWVDGNSVVVVVGRGTARAKRWVSTKCAAVGTVTEVAAGPADIARWCITVHSPPWLIRTHCRAGARQFLAPLFPTDKLLLLGLINVYSVELCHAGTAMRRNRLIGRMTSLQGRYLNAATGSKKCMPFGAHRRLGHTVMPIIQARQWMGISV
ncbi:hypothetical protein GGX14DRAFT_400878 [Mycena pura]|uniref:Uncharacterized protein n=1 Tax=Mycena pura TaxID=153505 RepID=A0AAD6Y410_9AGAR|nr:hypothetical protein GGX14DRAFT_400878 [Mycena pura]